MKFFIQLILQGCYKDIRRQWQSISRQSTNISEEYAKCVTYVLPKKKTKALQIYVKPLFKVVSASGFEPETVCLEGRCSIQLSYAPICNFEKITKTCRGGRIRTCDLLVPNQARWPDYATPRRFSLRRVRDSNPCDPFGSTV